MFKSKNRIIIICIVLFTFCISVQNVFAAECVSYKKGSGTIEDPYQITTIEELYSVNCNLDSNFILKNNLDLSNATSDKNGLFYNSGNGWISIGGKDGVFSGTFDGNNKTITGMKQKRNLGATYNELNRGGLFKNVSGTIKNLNLTNVDINFNETIDHGIHIGGITSELSGKILNSNVSGKIVYNGTMGNLSIYSPYSIGGIAGYISDNIEINNCISEVNITIDSDIEGDVGGITTDLYRGTNSSSSIISCINKGNIITNGQGAGGIVSDLGKGSIVSNCKNYGSISAEYAGGIVESLSGGKVTLSANYGTINAKVLGGGIASLSIMDSIIEKSYNVGTINTFESITDGTPGAGGIVGSSHDTIKDCFNIGIINDEKGVNSRTASIGGIAGTSTGTVTNTYSIGLVKSTNKNTVIGNIIGTNVGTLTNSYYFDNGIPGVGEISNSSYTKTGVDNSKKLTSMQFRNKDSYLGFDFTEVWNTDSNTTYPLPQISNNDLEGKYLNAIDLSYDNKIYIGEKIKFGLRLTPVDTLFNSIIWSVVNGTGEGTITKNGEFTGTKTGKVKVIATAEDFPVITGELEVDILPVPIEKIKIKENIKQVSLNNEYTFNAIITPDNTTNKNIIWSVVNGTGEGTITEDGKFIGTKTGKVTIVATSEENLEVKDSIEVEIIGVDVERISIKADSLYVNTGSSFYLKAFITPTNASVKDVIWSSSDTNIATIDPNTGGVATRYRSGIVTFTAVSSANSDIKSTITLYVGYATIRVGQTLSFGNSKYVTYDKVLWEVGDETIVKPTGKTGSTAVNEYYKHYIYLEGMKNGETTITMKTISGEVIASSKIYAYTAINDIVIKNSDVSVGVGKTKKLDVVLSPETISENLNKLIYVSSDDSIVKVDADGNIYGVNPGNATIYVYSQYSDVKKEIPVEVLLLASDLKLNSTNVNLTPNNLTHQIEYEISPVDATYKDVTYISSNDDIATVNEQGLVTGLKNGTVTITVTTKDGNISKDVTVVVSGITKNITDLKISPIPEQLYNSREIEPEIIIYDNNYKLIKGVDFNVSFENNVNEGTATGVIEGINDYYGSKKINFIIKKALIDYSSLGKTVVYDGKKYGISLNVITEGVSIKYADENGNYILDEMPQYTDAGNYEIKYMLTKENYATVKGSSLLIIEKADIKYSFSEREDYFDEYPSNLSHGNFDYLWINVSNPFKDYDIKFQDKDGNYTLDIADVPTKAGDMLINFQISAKNYNTIQSSMYRHSYGILNMHDSLRQSGRYLRIKDYTTDFNKLIEKLNVYSTKEYYFKYEHRDDDENVLINSPIKTGDRFVMLMRDDIIFHDWAISLLGDVNCDGKISALDYVKIKNHIMQTNLINSLLALDAADLNEDGKISALDYVRVKNHIMNGGK